LVVNDRWLLLPQEARWVPLDWEAPPERRSVSPSGALIAVLEDTGEPSDPALLRIGPVEGPLQGEVLVPRWAEAPTTPPAPRAITDPPPQEAPELLRHAFYWLDDWRLYVAQWASRGGQHRQACRVLDLRIPGWVLVQQCIEDGAPPLFALAGGPDRWLALYAAQQGVTSLILTRWHDLPLITPPGVPRFDPAPSGWVYPSFAADGSKVLLSTPCRLVEGGACAPEADPEAPWRLYGWPLSGGPVALLRDDLPPWATPTSREDRLAWPTPAGRVCVAPMEALRAPECFRVPTSPTPSPEKTPP
jgi:hypothetical protein